MEIFGALSKDLLTMCHSLQALVKTSPMLLVVADVLLASAFINFPEFLTSGFIVFIFFYS